MAIQALVLSTTVIVLFIICIVKYLTRNFDYWNKRNVKYLTPKICFGTMKDVVTFKVPFGEYLSRIYNSTNEPLYGLFNLDKPTLLIKDLEIIKLILVKDFHYFQNRFNAYDVENDPISAHMLFFSDNPEWKPTRSKFTSAFSAIKLKNFVPLITESSNDSIKYLDGLDLTKSVDIKNVCSKYTIDVVASCGFGIYAKSFESEHAQFMSMGKLFFDPRWSVALQQSAAFFMPDLAKLLKLKITPPKLAKFMTQVCSAAVQLREKSGSKRNDLIDIMVDMKRSGYFSKNEEELRITGLVTNFFLAGFETTGTTLSYLLYELALNKDVQDKLRQEIKLTKQKYGTLTYEALKEMKYLGMCLNETIRKYPSLPFLDRRCLQDYKIPNYDLTIEKDIAVYVSVLGIHHDHRYYPEPEKFDPERFSAENISDNVPLTFLGFGLGPRNCIGARFGLQTAKIGVAAMLEKYELVATKDTPTRLEFEPKSIILAPKVPIKLELRQL